MTQHIRAIFRNGVLEPLGELPLADQAEVEITVEYSQQQMIPESDNPLAGIAMHTGIPDLAEHFDDYRFGRRQP